MCLRGELREMHTLIERPPGQRKYLGENENFILAVFMKPYSPKLYIYKKNTHLSQSITGNVQ